MSKNVVSTSVLLVATLAAPIGIVGAAEELDAVDPESATQLRFFEEQLQATFGRPIGIRQIDVEGSPLPGSMEMLLDGGGAIYFFPEEERMLIGSVIDKQGRNLTKLRIDQLDIDGMADKIAAIPDDVGIVLGGKESDVTFIEFSDPDCPYCRAFSQQYERDDNHVQRRVIFTPIDKLHPYAAEKAVHILCSDDPAAEMARIYRDQEPEQWFSCENGIQELARHVTVAELFGVKVTPTFVVGDRVIQGANIKRIRAGLEVGVAR